jgi:outer membrane protein assembly factor BamB
MGLAKLGGCVVAAAVLLSGCWGQPGFGPANRRYNDLEKTLTAANVAGLTQDWTVGVGASLGEPIVSRGRVYVTGRNPDDFLRVRALAINNGAQLWDRQVADVIGSGGQVTLSRNELSVSHSLGFCPGGGITRLDPADGHELIFMETQPWGHVVTGSDIVADVRDDLCEPSGPATLVVRDADTLATLWTAVLPEANQPVSSDMTPTIAHGHIYVAVASTLYAYDITCPTTTCAPVWSQPSTAPGWPASPADRTARSSWPRPRPCRPTPRPARPPCGRSARPTAASGGASGSSASPTSPSRRRTST